MPATFGDKDQFPPNTLSAWRVIGVAKFVIGGSGAVSSTEGDPDIAAVNSGTGTFNLTYPAALRVKIQYGIEQSAAATVTEIIGTAVSATAGTASFRTSKAGTAVNPASSDILNVVIWAETR